MTHHPTHLLRTEVRLPGGMLVPGVGGAFLPQAQGDNYGWILTDSARASLPGTRGLAARVSGFAPVAQTARPGPVDARRTKGPHIGAENRSDGPGGAASKTASAMRVRLSPGALTKLETWYHSGPQKQETGQCNQPGESPGVPPAARTATRPESHEARYCYAPGTSECERCIRTGSRCNSGQGALTEPRRN